MKTYADMTREELLALKAELDEQFKTEEAKGHSFNMARGKPEFPSWYCPCRC